MRYVTRQTYNELVDLLTPHVKTPEDRRAFIQDKITTQHTQPGVDLSETSEKFASQLVRVYHDAGVLDSGEFSLIVLLQTLAERADVSMRDRIQQLIERVRKEFEDAQAQTFVGHRRTPEFSGERVGGEADKGFAGRSISTYTFINKVGEGGFGIVYRAFDDRTQQSVAVKVLPAARMRSAGAKERFALEAAIMQRFDHQNIIRLIDYWLDEDENAFLVMPWMAQGDLRKRLREGALPLKDVKRMFGQVCAALGEAHGQNIIHRDIKPDNIFVDGEDNAILGDFGVAKDTWAHANLTEEGVGVGTLSYGAPEQLIGDTGREKPQVDIYAMGITLFESVTGRYPFPGQTGKHLYMELPSLSLDFGHLPRRLDDVIQMATRKRREERYQTIQDFWEHLKSVLNGQSNTTRRAGEPASSQPGMEETAELTDDEFFALMVSVHAATLIHDPADLPDAEDQFAGRAPLLAAIADGLGKQRRVLLQGMGGVGKTALAKEAVRRQLQARDITALWVEVGHSNVSTLVEAMIEKLDQGDDLKAALAAEGVSLLILDDIWIDGKAIRQLLSLLPQQMQILATSRTRLPIGQIVDVDVVDEADALAILGAYAYQDYTEDTHARALAKLLGYHPYGLEIAAKSMLVDQLSPAELIQQIEDAPHRMVYPEDFMADGRESVAALVETSVEQLDSDVQRTFFAYGALFAPSVTAELLALLMETDEATAADHLKQLNRRGLARKQTGEATYRVHDLTYAYARENASYQPAQAVHAVEIYVEQHKNDIAPLDAERGNLLGAMEYAHALPLRDALVRLAYNLGVDASPPYFLARGYTDRVTKILRYAAEAAKRTNKLMEAHRLLGKLGDAYANFKGDYDQAIPVYEESLLLAQAMGDANRISIMSALIGFAYAQRGGQTQEALGFYERAEEIARFQEDDQALAKALEYRGLFHGSRKEYETARQYFADMLEAVERADDPFMRFYALNNLGTAEMDTGDYQSSYEHFQKMREIAQQQNIPFWIAVSEQSLGEVHHFLGDSKLSQQHLETAGEMYLEMGNTEQLREMLGRANSFGYNIEFDSFK